MQYIVDIQARCSFDYLRQLQRYIIKNGMQLYIDIENAIQLAIVCWNNTGLILYIL